MSHIMQLVVLDVRVQITSSCLKIKFRLNIRFITVTEIVSVLFL